MLHVSYLQSELSQSFNSMEQSIMKTFTMILVVQVLDTLVCGNCDV